MGHFAEMRRRFLRSVIAIGVATMLAFFFVNPIMEVLTAPAPDLDLTAIDLLENMSMFFKISLFTGFIVSFPYLIYQFFAFLTPAMTPRERRFVFTALPFIGVLFLAGVAFAYFVALPPALGFFQTFLDEWVHMQPRITSYINVVTRLIIGVGLAFELPIVIMALARLGIVSPQWLSGKRRIWIVVAFVLGALITPTFDPINQTIIALPLIILYELSIWLSKLVYRKKRERGLS
jgi:sec-independent protein translocase protein TatC